MFFTLIVFQAGLLSLLTCCAKSIDILKAERNVK